MLDGLRIARSLHIRSAALRPRRELSRIEGGLGRELSRIEGGLGRELLEPVDVHVVDAAIEQWCTTRFPGDRLPGGCAPSDTSGTLLATGLYSLSHELVHAIRLQHGFHSVPLIEEGLATMYGSSRPYVPDGASVDAHDPDVAPLPRLEHDRSEATLSDRSTGAHFLHWVGETYGRDPLIDLLWSDGVREADPAAIQASFTEAIGETMLAAQE